MSGLLTKINKKKAKKLQKRYFLKKKVYTNFRLFEVLFFKILLSEKINF